MMTEAEYQLFLKNHVLIVEGSRIGIIDERIIIKRSEARNTYANRFTELDGRRSKVFDRWLNDPHRKSCYSTWFSPTPDVLIYAQSTNRGGLYWNMYIPPEERRDTRYDSKVEPFRCYLELLDNTGGLLSWIASMVKEPMERSQEVPLLLSSEVHDSLFKLISILVNAVGTTFRSEHPRQIKARQNRRAIYSSVFHIINISNEITEHQIDNVKSYFDPYQKNTENFDQKNYTNILLISENEITLPRLQRPYITVLDVPASSEIRALEKKLAFLIQDSDFLDQVFSHLKKQP